MEPSADIHCGGCKKQRHVLLRDADPLLLIPEPSLHPRLSLLCPWCGSRRILVIPDAEAEQLANLGVPIERLDFAVPSGHIAGPPISEDDMIAFGREIEAATVIV